MRVTETVPGALAGERVDRVVAFVVGCSRAEAAAFVDGGHVRVGGRPVSSRSTRLALGDVLELDVPDDRGASGVEVDPAVVVPVVYADADVVVVDKPAGLVVHPGAGHAGGTMVNGLLAAFPDLAEVGDPARPGIVHRLDKDTSGLLVVARTPAAYRALTSALAKHAVEREYLALVWGRPDPPAGMVDAPIGRSAREPTRMAVSVRGRDARTGYATERTWDEPAAALLRCRLETGRTHQIRVHLAAIGHPVVGDRQYRGVRPELRPPRIFLHATRLAFRHPADDRPVAFDSPLPPDLEGVLSALG